MTVARQVSTFLLLIVCAVAFAGLARERTVRVLFVGNSLTYYNDLPATFATVYAASEPDARVETEMLAQAGGTLRERVRDGQLATLLTQDHYDVVVLQDLGGWPQCPRAFPGCADAPAGLREAVRLVRAHGARAVWFSTWRRQPAAQQELSTRVAALARKLHLDTVDAGAAIQRVPAGLRRRLLHEDGHPDRLGTWLIAAALAARVAEHPLPAEVPPASCGWNWRATRLTASRAASSQPRRRAVCHRPSVAQWRALRAALRRP